MDIDDIKRLFETKFSKHIYSLSKISEDDSHNISLCLYENEFFDFDKIAKEYHSSWATTDMIFFDLKREYIVFVEYKNGKIKSSDKPKIKQKFLDSFALFYKILDMEKSIFWGYKTYLLFVTNKNKNMDQQIHRNYLSSTDDFLNILEDNIILFGFDRYKPWYFDEIKTPFCDEFAQVMKNEFNITLEEEEHEQKQLNI
jgi:hypothetical protein